MGQGSQNKETAENSVCNCKAFKGSKLPLLCSCSEMNLKQSMGFYRELLKCMTIGEMKSKWEILETEENGIQLRSPCSSWAKSNQFTFRILTQLLAENTNIWGFAISHPQLSYEKFIILHSFPTRWHLLNFPTALQKTCEVSAKGFLQTDCSGIVSQHFFIAATQRLAAN